jgi:hypothetical protein
MNVQYDVVVTHQLYGSAHFVTRRKAYTLAYALTDDEAPSLSLAAPMGADAQCIDDGGYLSDLCDARCLMAFVNHWQHA